MHGVGAGPARRGDDLLDVQVAAGRLVRLQRDRLVGVADVGRQAITVGVDRNRRQPHLAAPAHDADRDLAAVGDEHLHRHGFFLSYRMTEAEQMPPQRHGPDNAGRAADEFSRRT